MNIRDYIKSEVYYSPHGQQIFFKNEKGGDQLLLDVRGWGNIQYLFQDENKNIDFRKAENFQDFIGEWIAESINQKLKSNE